MSAAAGWWARARRRSRLAPAALGVALALVATAAPTVTSTPARSTDGGTAAASVPIFPVSKLRRGMTGYGLTVVEGTRIDRFRVEFLGVERDAIAPGIDLILVRGRGKLIRRTSGFAAGMSGSPVYVGDRLVGAIAYGFFGGDFKVGGVTPAKPMLEILDYPNRTFRVGRWTDEIEMSDRNHRRAQRAAGGEGEMRPLTVPLAVSGLNGRALDVLSRSLERAGLPFHAVGGSSAAHPGSGAEPAPLPPGSVYSGVLSYGDLTLAGIGTTTARVGRRSVAFGHPFFFQGPTRLGLSGGKVLTVVRNILFPFKFATVGRPHGTLTQDRLAGVAGIAGRYPALIPVVTAVDNLDTGRSLRSSTRVVRGFDFFADVSFFAMLGALDRAFDRIGSGGASLAWVIKGTRASGEGFTFRRSNLFDSQFDVTFESLFEVLDNLHAISETDLEKVGITSVTLRGDLTQRRRTFTISDVAVSSTSSPEPVTEGTVIAQPGDTLTIDVTLRNLRGQTRARTLELVVPDHAPESMELVVRGGSGGSFFDGFLFDGPENGEGEAEPQSLDELLADLASAARNNDLVAMLRVVEGEDSSAAIAETRSAQSRVVNGSRFFEVVTSSGECPPEECPPCPPEECPPEEP